MVAYGPLGQGFLTRRGAFSRWLRPDDLGRANPRFHGDNLQRNLALLEAVRRLAAEKGATTDQVALAWLLAQGEDIVPIPGTKRSSRVDENAAAATLRLTPADLERLDGVSPPGAWAGAPRAFGAGATSRARA